MDGKGWVEVWVSFRAQMLKHNQKEGRQWEKRDVCELSLKQKLSAIFANCNGPGVVNM